MTLRATLAERLGLESAADADRREMGEFWQIERPMLLRHAGPTETPVERALRRADAPAGCGLRRILPDPGAAECGGARRLRQRPGGYCAGQTPTEHTLVKAPALRAMRWTDATCSEVSR